MRYTLLKCCLCDPSNNKCFVVVVVVKKRSQFSKHFISSIVNVSLTFCKRTMDTRSDLYVPCLLFTQLLESGKLKREDRVRFQRESKFYRLAVPVLKSIQNSDISRRSCVGTANKCTKKRDALAELLFCL